MDGFIIADLFEALLTEYGDYFIGHASLVKNGGSNYVSCEGGVNRPSRGNSLAGEGLCRLVNWCP